MLLITLYIYIDTHTHTHTHKYISEMCILAFFLRKKCKAFSKFSKLYIISKGLRTVRLEIIPEDTE